ncbi:MAG: DUF2778 domain-containing protein [Blastocatellia bacterium]|nr:DUF2778 domain-containing protein [Blastocatellia bacterium]
MGASFDYLVKERLFVGIAGNERFVVKAFSGGGGGSTHSAVPDPILVNNPAMTSNKLGTNQIHPRGGPLPAGTYSIMAPTRHPHLGLSSYLDPSPANHMFGRSGFFIHGRGPKGSDGCIVPELSVDFHRLMKALTRDGGGILRVFLQY